jgi:hypothetical protein
VEKLVAVVISAALAGSASSHGALRDASRLSGLRIRHPVPTATVSTKRYAVLFPRDPALSVDARFGLGPRSIGTPLPRAWYDVRTHRLFLQRTPAAGRRAVIQEYVRALIDQNFRLGRLVSLRSHDHDRFAAAEAMVDGTAALASGLRPPLVRGTPLERFSALEAGAGLGAGRALAAQLRYLGGRSALADALRTFPQTTEQLLHVDKFLERERALPVHLPARAGSDDLVTSETFGELDVRNLLQAFGVRDAAVAADGWGGGRLALYGNVAVIVLRWDTAADAAEWQAAVPGYVAAAFPGAAARTCPPLDACWGDISAGVFGTTSVLASGPGSAVIAAALLRQS